MIDAALSETERRVVLVDGFNVLHALLEGAERGTTQWWRRAHRDGLLRQLARWPVRGDALWVAFDGAQPAWSLWAEPVARVVPDLPDARPIGRDASPSPPRGGVSGPFLHSVFVESADDWIVRRARRARDPKRTVVVSRDRQVAGRCRSAGCEVWSPWQLLAQCDDPPEPERGRAGDQSPNASS